MKKGKSEDYDMDGKVNSGTRARIELREIDSVASARKSAGDKEWLGQEVVGEDDESVNGQEESLDATDARLYRGVAARLN